MQLLVNDLRKYSISTVSHDCYCIKGSLSQWLEREVQKTSAVLCICNAEFKQEWDESISDFPLVSSLKQLIYANVNKEEGLSKYATVLLRKSDRECIPTPYLLNTRNFYVNEPDDIARFVHQVPAYCTCV